MTTTDRETYIAAIRALADLLAGTPALPLPTHVASNEITWSFGSTTDDPATKVAETIRHIPGPFAKNDPTASGYDSTYYTLKGSLAGFPVEVWAYRDAVCEKVVTGTEQVTKLVPDPDAPKVEVVETVETFTWQCKPILAEATS